MTSSTQLMAAETAGKPIVLVRSSREQADVYMRAAVRTYMQARHSGQEDATKAVNARIEGAVDRFVAMDKAGELDRFLEACPQPDETDGG